MAIRRYAVDYNQDAIGVAELPPFLREPDAQRRSAEATIIAVDRGKRTVELAFSSETPVDRYYGIEILDHSPGAADLSRLNNGAALLYDHDTKQQIGVVESARIDDDRVGRAIVRFSRNKFADEIFNDVADGIRRKVSFGYRVHEWVESGAEGNKDTYRITSWQPNEISIVPIPADDSVGVGRSVQQTPQKKGNENMTIKSVRLLRDPQGDGGGGASAAPPVSPAPVSEAVRSTPAPTPAPQPSVNVESERRNGTDAEFNRVSELMAIGTRHGRESEAHDFICERKSVAEFKDYILENKRTDSAAASAEPAPRYGSEGMSSRDLNRYSILRAIMCRVEGGTLDGLEGEMSQEVARRTGNKPSGFFIPEDVLNARMIIQPNGERVLSVSDAVSAGNLVADNLQAASMIELLRNRTIMGQLGVRQLSGLVGNISIPKHTGEATATWEDEGGELSESDQETGQVKMSPKRVGALTFYTKELLAQSSVSVESFIRDDLMRVLALKKDLGFLTGSGGDAQPVGLMSVTGVNAITFGAAPTWAKVVEFESEVDTDNALMGSLHYVTTPAVKGAWKTTEKASNTAKFIWDDGSTVNGYPAHASNQVPDNKVIFGNFADAIAASWAGLDIVVDPYTRAGKAQVGIVINEWADFAVRHAESFAISTDAGNQ